MNYKKIIGIFIIAFTFFLLGCYLAMVQFNYYQTGDNSRSQEGTTVHPKHKIIDDDDITKKNDQNSVSEEVDSQGAENSDSSVLEHPPHSD